LRVSVSGSQSDARHLLERWLPCAGASVPAEQVSPMHGWPSFTSPFCLRRGLSPSSSESSWSFGRSYVGIGTFRFERKASKSDAARSAIVCSASVPRRRPRRTPPGEATGCQMKDVGREWELPRIWVVSQFDSAATPPRATALAPWATWPQVVSSEGLRNRGSSRILRSRVGAPSPRESVYRGHEHPLPDRRCPPSKPVAPRDR